MGNSTYVHDFFIEHIQDACIIELHLLEKWGDIVDITILFLHLLLLLIFNTIVVTLIAVRIFFILYHLRSDLTRR